MLTAQKVRQRRRRHHRGVPVPPNGDRHGRDRDGHEAGERQAEDIGTDARIADDNGNTAERHQAGQHGLPSGGFPQPYPGEGRGDERACCDNDRHVRHAGQLQGRDERHHAKGRQRCDQPAALPDPGQIAQTGSALHQRQKRRDETAAEQPSPEQDRPGVEGQ
jgi:hypothetical protein